LSGALHEARARVALVANDSLAYNDHLAQTETWFRRTRNPVLVARAERLAAEGRRITAPRRTTDRAFKVVGTSAVTTPPPENVSALFTGCRGSGERATRALRLVIDEAHGASGYLFLANGGELVLAAPTWGDEPPPELARSLARLIARPEATIEPLRRADGRELPWKPVLLVVRRDPAIAVGGVAVIGGAVPLADPNPRLVDEIARELFEAGDASALA
jgi:hypothetical protein